MLAEQEFRGAEGALCIGLANVVHVDAASVDIFASLSFRQCKSAKHEQFDEWNRAFELWFFNLFGRHFADDVVEGAFGDSLQPSTKENFAGADGFSGGRRAVDQVAQDRKSVV